jgi:hypothetical protein
MNDEATSTTYRNINPAMSAQMNSQLQPQLETAPLAGPKQQWASLADWEPYKEIITNLYFDQDRPLKAVIEIMREKYDFRATYDVLTITCLPEQSRVATNHHCLF